MRVVIKKGILERLSKDQQNFTDNELIKLYKKEIVLNRSLLFKLRKEGYIPRLKSGRRATKIEIID